jgi:hypothetical protein
MTNLSDLIEPEYKAAKDSLLTAVAAGGGASGRSVYTTITNEDSYVVSATNPLYAVALEARASNTSQKRVFDFDGSDLPSSTYANVTVDSTTGKLSPSYDGVSTATGNTHFQIKWGNNSSNATFFYNNGGADAGELGFTVMGHPSGLGVMHYSQNAGMYKVGQNSITSVDHSRCQSVMGLGGSYKIKCLRTSDHASNKYWVIDLEQFTSGTEKIYEVEIVDESGLLFMQNPVLIQDISGCIAAVQVSQTTIAASGIRNSFNSYYWVCDATEDIIVLKSRTQSVNNEVNQLRALVINRSTGAYKWFVDPNTSEGTISNFFLHNGIVHYWTFDSASVTNFYQTGWIGAIHSINIDDWSESFISGSTDTNGSLYRHMTYGCLHIGTDRVYFSPYNRRSFNFSTNTYTTISSLNGYFGYSVLRYIPYDLYVSDTFFDNNEWSWSSNSFTMQTDPAFYYPTQLASYTNGGYVERVINTVDAVSIDGPLVAVGTGLSAINYSITQVGITNQPLTYEPTAAQKAAIIALDSITFRIDINMTDTTSPPKLDYIKIPVTVKDRYVTSAFLTTAINSDSVSIANSGLVNRAIMISIIEA